MKITSENIVPWQKLKIQREQASNFPLDILIWGPSDDGSPEYTARCEIRDKLKIKGHNACFSEERCKDTGALKNPLDDEYLQADSAHAIVVVYEGRGTQTERDKFLDDVRIASKVYILVSNMTIDKIYNSLVSVNWKEMERIAHVIRYKDEKELKEKITDICDTIDQLRGTYYVRYLENIRKNNL